jgi:acid stress-induced BolA-like protein IbaG/YrbA
VHIDEIKQLIANGLPGAEVMLDGDGTHFQTTVVSDHFCEKTRLQRHQMVYKTLGEKMGREIHALSIQAFTRVEWENQKDLGVIRQ